MKNKGFTMVELLAVISLLAIVILIAVPTFGSVRDRTNQSIYESKIASVKAASEAYSEETGEIAFDVGTLISQGKLEADNESGEYRNPVNGDDMRCYAVEVRYENLQYYANVHETSRCLSQEELQDMYGTIKIQAFKNDGNPLVPIHENWYNESLKLGYELKKSELASQIEQITWVGDRSITCTKEAGNLNDCTYYGGSLLGSAGSIQTMKVSLEIVFKLENGAVLRGKAQKQLLIDMEGPKVLSVEASPGMTNQSGKQTEIEMTDGNGSGLKEYRVVKVASENDVPTCKNLDGYQRVEQSKMVEYLDNGWYYTCVRDNALNDNQDTVAQTKKQVTGVDYSQVNGASLTVENKDENTPMKVKATITIPSTEDASKLKMCVSNTGHLKDCSWEAFKSSFDWTFPGHADCVNRTLYVSISDEVGNITNLVNNPYSPHSVVKYDGNGVTLGAADAKKSVCYGGSYSMPNVTKEGHTFSGWFTAKSGGTQLKNTDKVNYDGVKTYYARWTVNKYYLDLNGLLDGSSSGNIAGYGTADVYIGGSPAGNDITDYYTQHPYGTTYEIKDIKATTGHTSEGVSSGSLSGKVGVGGKNTVVQLKFKTNSYTVSWKGNGGSVTKNGATSVKYNTAVGTLGTATRAGYRFDGWYTASAGGSKIDANTKVTGNVTYFAHWTPDKFSITYNANGGNGSMAKQEANNGSSVTLSPNSFTHDSKVFGGWATSPGGRVEYIDKATITLNSNITLYAKWVASEMHMSGKNLIMTSKFKWSQIRYTIIDSYRRHSSFGASVAIITDNKAASRCRRGLSDSSGQAMYVVPDESYKFEYPRSSSYYKGLNNCWFLIGVSGKCMDDLSFIVSEGQYTKKKSSYSFSTGITSIDKAVVKFKEGSSIKTAEVGDSFEISTNFYATNCTAPTNPGSIYNYKYCDLILDVKFTIENYKNTSGHVPTSIGATAYEIVEESDDEGGEDHTRYDFSLLQNNF